MSTWTLETLEHDLAVLRAPGLLGTLYAPTGGKPAHLDIDALTVGSTYRPVLSLPLLEVPEWITGKGRRSVHRAAVEGLLTQWSGKALAACVHAVLGTHSAWCVWDTCPIAHLQQAHTQQAG